MGAGGASSISGELTRAGSWKGLQDTQPADRQPTSGCPSLLSLLFVPKICMLTYIHVHTYIHLYTYIFIHTCNLTVRPELNKAFYLPQQLFSIKKVFSQPL